MFNFINRDKKEVIPLPNYKLGALFLYVRKHYSVSSKNPQKCMSQEEMAEFLDTTIESYGAWERGKVVPEDYNLIQFAAAFNMDWERFNDLKYNVSEKKVLEVYSKIYDDDKSINLHTVFDEAGLGVND